VQVVLIGAESREELLTAFETMKKNQVDGLLVQADDLFINEGTRIIELAATYRLPAIYRLGYQAEAGGLMAYGPNISDMYRRAAYYVDKILKGAKPGDLPVEQPTKVELVINLKTAKEPEMPVGQVIGYIVDKRVDAADGVGQAAPTASGEAAPKQAAAAATVSATTTSVRDQSIAPTPVRALPVAGPVRASPYARRIAQELGVDLMKAASGHDDVHADLVFDAARRSSLPDLDAGPPYRIERTRACARRWHAA
jgi:hypothetical protein